MFTVDDYTVVLTFASAPSHGEIVRARLENSRSGEVLAEMTFADPWVGYGGFEFVDASGNTLAAIDSRTVNSAAARLRPRRSPRRTELADGRPRSHGRSCRSVPDERHTWR
jgi:hypothetical protein